jgi:hypothetical protein
MLKRVIIINILLIPAAALAVEPLQGPEIAWSAWSWQSNHKRSDQSIDDYDQSNFDRSRRLAIDAPLPIPMWVAMPFVTLRYEDRQPRFGFQSDQRYGVGLLHHAAEGDPAWRLELFRLGNWKHKPTPQFRSIFNLLKAIPGLKLRPSDSSYSWVGINVLKQPNSGKFIFIPELAWSKRGADGLTIDILIPKHLYLGYHGGHVGAFLGIQQSYRFWQLASEPQTNDGIIEKKAKMSITYDYATNEYGEFLLTTSFMALLDSIQPPNTGMSASNPDQSPRGVEFSIQWTPNA